MADRGTSSRRPLPLYLGFWIVPVWWENEEDWRLGARYCDIISYDRYADVFADDPLLRNMLRYAARDMAEPLRDPPADFNAQIKAMGYG